MADARPTVTARAVDALRRLAAIVPVVLRTIRRLGVLSSAAVTIVWVASLSLATPDGSTAWITRILILVAALVPGGVLFLFAAGIDDLRDLPNRYRELPADVRSGLTELRPPPGQGRRGAIRSLIALARTAIEAREALSPFAIVTAALRPALLLAAVAAAFVALLEIPIAAIVLLVLAI
jgi:hypothetical protein